MTTLGRAHSVLDAATRAGAFPAAVVEVGRHDQVTWTESFGHLSQDADASATPLDAVFDLASLTKVIATTTLAMEAIDRDLMGLTDRVGRWLPAWQTLDRVDVTVRDLLAHASGLTPHLPFFRDHHGRADFEQAICTLPLEYPPRSRSLYSDLGFILLGFILEDRLEQGVAGTFDARVKRCGWGELRFRPPADWRPRTAPTEVDPWRGRLLVGEVHDENAWALAGVAGHSGVFGTAAAVGAFARTVLTDFRGAGRLAHPEVFARFVRRTNIPGSSRALGWDTMLPTSSCGTRMSPRAIGHTGFTGTSLWIDPDADLYVVLLTNRVHPTRDNDAILGVRPVLHDAVVEEFSG